MRNIRLHQECVNIAHDKDPFPSCASITFLALVGLLLLAISPVHAAPERASIEVATLESGAIVVRFERSLLNTAKEIVRLSPSVKNELAKLLQWEFRFRPEVILIKDDKTFQMIAHSKMVVAFADPERQLIVIDCSRVGAHPFDLDVTFKHELCHLLLHAHIPVGLPRWLDEGVAQWATGGLAEIFMNDRRSVLMEAALAGRLFRFDDLSDSFPEDRHGLVLAYEQSRSLVEYIVETYGAPRLLQLLNALKDGSTMDDAVQKNLGLTMGELERNWASHLGKRSTWLIYVSNNLYEILFFFASLITVIAAAKIIARRLRVRISRKEEDEEQEKDYLE
ncbi:MAG: peptidase MA family metallohydrolase [Syntrophorhabdales bacterium]|jgi:hypothetical protein